MADELDQLYATTPENFTALRTELAAEAKKRGDAAAAKQLSGARKPTTAAWVVNQLTTVPDAVARLRDLGSRLRAAHAAGSGERIRELTAEQRRLTDELTQAALTSAGHKNPTPALRDDVHATVQAAVADPDVAARIGRLVKAERWSGFGDFGDVTVVSTSTRSTRAPRAGQAPVPKSEPSRDRAAQRARDDVKAAEQAKGRAQEALSEKRSQLDAAREARDEARRALQKAERELSAAESAYDKAERAVDAAAKAVREARSRLKGS